MSRSASIRYAVFLVSVIVLLGGITISKGVFLVGQHDGDALHLAQIMVLRLEGWRPHQDFMTPIGYLAFWPIELMMRAGYPLGQAFFLAQALVAVILMPAIWRVGISRFSNRLAYLMGAVALIWILGLVHGEVTATTAMSMHYNRWAWAISALVLFTALLPGSGRHCLWADAVVIGVGLAALGLSKATFAVAFIPGVLVALIATRRFGLIWRALVAGLLFLAAFTALWGVDFWALYVGDLLSVMESQMRPYPHRPFGNVLAAPEYMGATLLLLAAVVVLRHGGRDAQGLAILVLAPAFIYVTFQNFGNDPKWLLIVGLILAALLPVQGQKSLFGADLRQVQLGLVVAAFALNLPSLINIASSGWRNSRADIADYSVLVPNHPALVDVRVPTNRGHTLDILLAAELNDVGVDHLQGVTERSYAVEIAGETLPYCRLNNGFMGYMKAFAAELGTLGIDPGKSVLVADVFSAAWLYGDTAPVRGISPWHYGGAPGLDHADYLSVPLCPIRDLARKAVVDTAFARDDLKFEEVSRGKMQILYRITPAAASQ